MTWTKKLIGDEDQRAVSPVIGVILMVAITVILAAVIAAFVMDIGPGGDPVQASLELTEGEITVTNAENVDALRIGPDTDGYATDANGDFDASSASSCAAAIEGGQFSDGEWGSLEVGAVSTFATGSGTDECDDGDSIQIIGTTEAGGEEILIDDEL